MHKNRLLSNLKLSYTCYRCPFLLDVLMTVQTGAFKVPHLGMMGPLITVYGILLHQRDIQLSAFQRLLTLLCVKGKADDDLITRLNKLGITLSTRSKLNILETCGTVSRKNTVQAIKSRSYVKITGDNLDMYVRTQHQASDRSHRDLHLFTSNLITHRLPLQEVPNAPPIVDVTRLTPEDFLPSVQEKHHLLEAYGIIIGRLMAKHLTAFRWMEAVLPQHIPHRYSDHMALKSDVHPLPIMMKNEAKYEDCVDIMDMYEDELIHLFTEAFGDTSVLDEKKVVVGGDQLTRVRLQGAKRLRAMAPERRKKFEHLFPIVCEMWHNKQDLLHKAYKALYRKESCGQRGTLYYYKVLLHRTDVNGNVKSNFKAHWDLLITAGSLMILEQVMEHFGMETPNSPPTKHQPPPNISKADKEVRLETTRRMLNVFLNAFKYGNFSFHDEVEACPPQAASVTVKYVVVGVTSAGHKLVIPVQESPKTSPKPPEDRVFNYCCNLSHWALHLMELEDTAKEGDLDRQIINCKYNIPFFFSHSKLSKYFVENIDYVLKAQYILSPQMRLRVLEGSFVNVKGGKGRNVEADLVQEHSVRNRKDLIRSLGANKSEKAIKCVTNAADAVSYMAHSLDNVLDIKRSGSRHAKFVSDQDIMRVQADLRTLRPFRLTPGRECTGFDSVFRSPFQRINKPLMRQFMRRNIQRLSRGQAVETEDDDDCGHDASDEEVLPDIA